MFKETCKGRFFFFFCLHLPNKCTGCRPPVATSSNDHRDSEIFRNKPAVNEIFKLILTIVTVTVISEHSYDISALKVA